MFYYVLANRQFRYPTSLQLLNVQFVTNRLGNQSLVHNGFQYRVKQRRDNRCYWICTTRNCRATINTLDSIPVKLPDAHNHPNHQTKLKVDSVLKSIKKRCREETTPIPTIYDQEVNKLRNPEWNEDAHKVVEQLPTFESSRGSFYNERVKIIPILPATRSDIILEGQWTLTAANQRFLIADDGNDERILIFSTQQNLTHFTAADIIYGDGTFYTCPDVFTQLYTFHTYVDGTMYPLVYALLPGKSETVYTRFLTLLKQACDQHQLQLQPSTIYLDYEIAIRNAAYRIFPGITAKDCFFHYTQCIWRKTQDTGLQIHYKNNNHIKTLVRRAAVLPLVPIEHVQDI